MVMLVDSEKVGSCSSTKTLYEEYPDLVSSAETFIGQAHLDVQQRSALYVKQQEYAVVRKGDGRLRNVGSDHAGTCHIVILYHDQSHGVAVAHYDGSNNPGSHLTNMVKKLVHGYGSKTVDVYAIGGIYHDYLPDESNEKSQDLSMKLIRRLIESKYNFNIKQWCCCELNTKEDFEGKVCPKVHGLCWDRDQKRAFPAVFHYHGPARNLRAAAFFCNKGNMRNLYNSKQYQIKIKSFSIPSNISSIVEDLKKDNFKDEEIVKVRFFVKYVFKVISVCGSSCR